MVQTGKNRPEHGLRLGVFCGKPAESNISHGSGGGRGYRAKCWISIKNAKTPNIRPPLQIFGGVVQWERAQARRRTAADLRAAFPAEAYGRRGMANVGKHRRGAWPPAGTGRAPRLHGGETLACGAQMRFRRGFPIPAQANAQKLTDHRIFLPTARRCTLGSRLQMVQQTCNSGRRQDFTEFWRKSL